MSYHSTQKRSKKKLRVVNSIYLPYLPTRSGRIFLISRRSKRRKKKRKSIGAFRYKVTCMPPTSYPKNVDRSHTCSFENCSLYQSHNSALIEEARAYTPSFTTAANLGNRTTDYACNSPWVPQSVASGSLQAQNSLISSSLVVVVVVVVVKSLRIKKRSFKTVHSSPSLRL